MGRKRLPSLFVFCFLCLFHACALLLQGMYEVF